MTNFENIKSMTTAELANLLQNECMCSHCNRSTKGIDSFEDVVFECGIKDAKIDCLNGCYEWLNDNLCI